MSVSRRKFEKNSKRFEFIFALIIALVAHLAIFQLSYRLSQRFLEKKPTVASPTKQEKVKVRIVEGKRRQIIEAPLAPTEPPTEDAFLGQQNHRTEREQKLPPSPHRQRAPATRYSGRPTNQNSESNPDEGKIVEGEGGYRELLPDKNDFAGYFNDFIADDGIPTGEVLDVNTTEYRFVGYFTSVRKQVDLAFYDPRSSLKNEPKIKEQLIKAGRVSFQGVSVVQLTVARSGLLIDSQIVESSGDTALDQAWLRILNLAAPYPPLPHHYEGDKLVFTYALYYDFVVQDQQTIRRFHF